MVGIADRTFLKVPCPHCGNELQQSIAWLVAKDRVPCRKCGRSIELKGTNNGLVVEKLSDECDTLDRTITALNKKS
jgi:ribosomal protein S27E